MSYTYKYIGKGIISFWVEDERFTVGHPHLPNEVVLKRKLTKEQQSKLPFLRLVDEKKKEEKLKSNKEVKE